MAVEDRIIVPLDVPSEEKAIALVEQLPQVTFWKVGLELFVSSGPQILRTLKIDKNGYFLTSSFTTSPILWLGLAVKQPPMV
jgi:orotidine-5'-phosphate decarboxylase